MLIEKSDIQKAMADLPTLTIYGLGTKFPRDAELTFQEARDALVDSCDLSALSAGFDLMLGFQTNHTFNRRYTCSDIRYLILRETGQNLTSAEAIIVMHASCFNADETKFSGDLKANFNLVTREMETELNFKTD